MKNVLILLKKVIQIFGWYYTVLYLCDRIMINIIYNYDSRKKIL